MALRTTLLGAAALVLTSVAPAPDSRPSAQALAMLDPTALASSLCGRKAEETLRQRLRLAALLSAPAQAAEPPTAAATALRFPVTTSSDEARRNFLQGLLLTYGFNHAAAIASFRAAQAADPECAMCWWGEALAYGPNINAAMEAGDQKPTLAALAKAKSLRAAASPTEQALIDALVLRYSGKGATDRAALDAAYADAMLAVARQFPDDDDVALLAAEAAMDTRPWDYWEADRTTPRPRIADAVQLVETVLARNPAHPQAAHLYIHLMENNVSPQRAEAAADRLVQIAPTSAGHLVHMPAHIYYRLGRFADSIRVNVAAARADEAYLASAGDNPLYRYGYYPHNVHFIVTSAQMAGDMRTAVREALRLGAILKPEVTAKFGWIQAINAAPYLAYAQFADADQILTLPVPDPRLPYVAGMRHYARAVAYAQRHEPQGFAREIDALKALRTTGKFEDLVAQGMPVPDLLQLAETVARGRYAYAQGQYADAVRIYRDAIAIEDRIPYMEPPYWYFPVRQSLGAALFAAGDFAGARDAFRESLVSYPANAWALYGLAAAESALGERVEAAAADQAFQRAWLGDRRWLSMDRL